MEKAARGNAQDPLAGGDLDPLFVRIPADPAAPEHARRRRALAGEHLDPGDLIELRSEHRGHQIVDAERGIDEGFDGARARAVAKPRCSAGPASTGTSLRAPACLPRALPSCTRSPRP